MASLWHWLRLLQSEDENAREQLAYIYCSQLLLDPLIHTRISKVISKKRKYRQTICKEYLIDMQSARGYVARNTDEYVRNLAKPFP